MEGWRGQGDYGYAIVNRYEMGFVYPYTTVTDVYINIIDHWFYGCQRILYSLPLICRFCQVNCVEEVTRSLNSSFR